MNDYNEHFWNGENKQDSCELLANLLVYPKRFEQLHKQFEPEHFGSLANVFYAMSNVFSRDHEISVKAVMREVGAEHFELIQRIKDAAISDNRTDWLVDRVKKEKARRDLIRISDRIKLSALNDDPSVLIQEAIESMQELTLETSETLFDPVKDYEDFVARTLEIKANPAQTSGLITGSIDLDRITNGWQRTDLIVIGARTSIGKSAFALSNIVSLAQSGYKCAVFSLEMSKSQVYARMAACAYSIPLFRFRDGGITDEQISKLLKRESWWNNIVVDDTRGVTADHIGETMMRIKKEYGLDFVVVDYLQDIREIGEHNDNQGSALARICRKLRKSAQECDVAIMAMSQVSREVEKRNDKRPSNSDLSGSTGIETSADLIGLLYREDYYNPETSEKNILELNITKHRNGSLGTIKFFYDRVTQQIRALETKIPYGFSSVRNKR